MHSFFRTGTVMAGWHRGKHCPTLPTPVVVKGMPLFPLQLPRTMPLASRPGPGHGGARCTEAAILGLMPRFSHAQQACQVCQCSQWWHSVSGGWWHSGKDSPPLPSTVRMQGRPARCVSALSGGTVGRTVRRSRLPSGCRVQGMSPFPLQLPRTMALASRPRPGPGGARCTGAGV